MKFMASVFMLLIISSGCAATHKNSRVDEKVITIDNTKKERIKTLFEDGWKQLGTDAQHALAIYIEAIKIAPERWETHYNAGIAYLKMHDTENAEKEFTTALKYSTASPSTIYNAIGVLHATTGKNTEALEAFKKALASEKSPHYMINAANLLYRMGRQDEAIKYYTDAEKIDPLNHTLHHNMAILSYINGEYKKAQENFNKTMSSKQISFYKAQTFLKLGEYEAALNLYNELRDQDPQDPVPYKNIGILYEIYLGDMEKALENYNTYIDKGGEQATDVRTWMDVVKAKSSLKAEK